MVWLVVWFGGVVWWGGVQIIERESLKLFWLKLASCCQIKISRGGGRMDGGGGGGTHGGGFGNGTSIMKDGDDGGQRRIC